VSRARGILLRVIQVVPFVGVVGLLACGAPDRPRTTPRQADLQTHPAVGCWSLAVDGDSGYALVPRYLRLDSTLWLPHDTGSTARVLFDSLSDGPGLRDGTSVPYWLPYPGLATSTCRGVMACPESSPACRCGPTRLRAACGIGLTSQARTA
jgi:hypothetical protein